MAPCFGRPSPDPRLGSVVELGRGYLHRSLDLIRIGKALTRERIPAEEAPPALLQIQPTRPFRDEDLLETRMVYQPGAGCQAVMTAQIVGNDEDVAGGIVHFEHFQQCDVIGGVARGGAASQLFAVAYP